MSNIFDKYEYLKKLWSDFYGLLKMNEETEEMTHALENQLDKKTRWELIQLIDQMNLECERISLESFISGFQMAMGIAREVSYEAKFFEERFSRTLDKCSDYFEKS